MNGERPSRPYVETLGPDLLRGASQVAGFLLGEASESNRRKVYHLAATSQMPHFLIGSMICARRSTLLQWIEQQERRGGQLPPAESNASDS